MSSDAAPAGPPSPHGATGFAAGTDPLWYKDAVVYELHIKAYADANGDGVMEILVDWGYYEGSGIRVYALRDGKPVETELGYFNGL